MIAKTSKVRNKLTGQVFEVIPGSLMPEFFEDVVEDIKVGEPKIEVEIEEIKDEPKKAEEKPKKAKKARKSTKKSKKGAKKNATSKE